LADDASLIRPTEIDNYHFVIWIPSLCEGHQGSQLKPRLADDALLIRPTEVDFYHQLIAIWHSLAKGINAPNKAKIGG
jgi:hypothetical protein